MRAHIRDAIALGITTALLGAVREYGRPIEVALPIDCAASVARQDQFGFGLVIAVGDGRMVHDRFSYRKPFVATFWPHDRARRC